MLLILDDLKYKFKIYQSEKVAQPPQYQTQGDLPTCTTILSIKFRIQDPTETGADWYKRQYPGLDRSVCEVGTVGKISDYQPEGPGFNPRPGRGLYFGRPSFATPSMERDLKPLV